MTRNPSGCRQSWRAAILVALILAVPAVWPAAAAPSCSRPAFTIRSTTAYRTPPTFVTGRGLVFGEPWGALPPNLRVFVCGSTRVGFGFSTQTWAQIAYFTEQRAWRFGWVPDGDLRLAAATRAAVAAPAGLSPAFAGPLGPGPGAPGGERPRIPAGADPPLNVMPPPPPALPQTMGGGGVQQEGSLTEFYLWSFVALIFGMAARVGQDALESEKGKTLRTIIREMLTPLFVSPIVFLGFMQTAKVIVTDLQGFLILLLLAFQSGFFWQTVMNARKAKAA